MKQVFSFFTFFLFLLNISSASAQTVILDNFNKAEVTNFYREYYCPLDGIESEWNGTLQSYNPGTTSSAFKNAVLDRIYFYRVMTGLTNHVEISNSMTNEAQRLSHLISSNQNYSSATLMDPDGRYLSRRPERYEETLYFYDESSQLIKDNYAAKGGDIGEALVNLIRGDWNRNHVWSGFDPFEAPIRLYKLLSPTLNSIGIGTVELAQPYITATGSSDMKDFSSGVLLFNESSDLNASFQPVLWPPAGYVPHAIAGRRWSALIPGADMRGAYLTVKQIKGTEKELVNISRLPYEEGTPTDRMFWYFSDGRYIGDRRNYDPSGNDEIHIEVTIGNIYHNGSFHNFTYEVRHYNPYSNISDFKIAFSIPPKVKDIRSSYLQYKVFNGDGCLLETDGYLSNEDNYALYLQFSTSPEGPFTTKNVVDSLRGDGERQFTYEDGFYRFAVSSTVTTGPPDGEFLNYDIIHHSFSEVLQYSTTLGLRKLDQPFGNIVDPIDMRIAHENNANNNTGSSGGNGSSPEGNSNNDGSNNDNSGNNDSGSISASDYAAIYQALPLNDLQAQFLKLKKKKRKCRKRKKRGACSAKKCKNRCRRIRAKFRAAKQEMATRKG